MPDAAVTFQGSVWAIPDLPYPCACGECDDSAYLGDEYFVVLEDTAVVCVWIPSKRCAGWVEVGGNINYSMVTLTPPTIEEELR